jgi:NAD(P)-dependent dehydrogenase (short-subunit alcohol dehydrogenase family)
VNEGERLAGRVAVITGGASGIGRASAEALAAEGARAVIADVDEENGVATAEAIGDALFVKTDVRVSEDVQSLIEEVVRHYGRLDVLFNNAGISVPGKVADISEDEWARVLDVNLSGVWRGMRYAAPVMIQAGHGSIINNASVQALVGVPGWAGYAASKGGVIALTRQAAVELAPSGVRVNAIAPGTILTPMNERIFARAPELAARWQGEHPLARLGRPQDVAGAVVFLASDDAAFVTGECLRVDGGLVVNGSRLGLEEADD